MKTPRCSLPDLPVLTQARRRRQAPAPTKWNKRNLSWRVRTFPRDSPLGHDTVRALMYYALKVWSDIAPLNFHEVAGSTADIQIDFSKADHNDGYPFDGPGGTVAHAFFPGDHHTAGDTHFDDDEAWTFRSSDAHGMDLFAVAVHEFGHAIGLSHVAAAHSIMRPYYQGP
ncbi:MMP17 isoform 10, partial [Pan troglodytes]